MPSTVQRLGFARELLAERGKLKEWTGTSFVGQAQKRADALSRVLLGETGDGPESIDLFAVSHTAHVLGRMLDGLEGAERDLADEYIRRMSVLLYQAAGDSRSAKDSLRALRDKAVLSGKQERMDTAAALLAEYGGKGQVMQDAASGIAPMVGRLKVIDKESADSVEKSTRAVADAREQFIQRITAIAQEAANAGRWNGDYQKQMQAQWEAEWAAERARIIRFYAPNTDGDRAEKNRIASEMCRVGAELIDDLLAQSPISRQQAQAWADAQVIGKAAQARLKKMGYGMQYVRWDMAEFYRLSRGRLGNIRIESAGGRRANATDIDSSDDGIINLGSRFDKRTLFHELAHHLEQDPAAQQAAQGFLAKRRTKDSPVPLRKLTGNKGYGPDETAYPDDFISPYIGKFYPTGLTEVFSMGVESFSDPALLAMRIAKDPEMFSLIAGFLQSEPHPLFQAMKRLYGQANTANKVEA